MPGGGTSIDQPGGGPAAAAGFFHAHRVPANVPVAPAGEPVATGRPAPATAPVVAAVIPCHNRQSDLDLLLADLAVVGLARPGLPGAVSLTEIVVVDNASDPPLDPGPDPRVRQVRPAHNLGGAGGFNAGLRAVLDGAERDPDFLWLIDSDARPEAGALEGLVAAMADSDVVAAGSVLCDPDTGEPFEQGGGVSPRTGELWQARPGAGDRPTGAAYVAACSLVVRSSVVRHAGLMADVFLNGDDVEWCLRLARVTGGRVVAAPASRVRHPRPDRMRTMARYYSARNAFAVLDAARAAGLGTGARARGVRALRETGRAVAMHLVGRHDLAALHLAGLADAAAGRVNGPAPDSTPRPAQGCPIGELPAAMARLASAGRGLVLSPDMPGDLRGVVDRSVATGPACAPVRVAARGSPILALAGAACRLVLGLGPPVAVVSGRGRPEDWAAGRCVIVVSPGSFTVWRPGPRDFFRAIRTAAHGCWLAARLAALGPGASPRIEYARPAAARVGAPAADLSVIVLSYNRRAALERTLAAIGSDPDLVGSELIVVDNASTDGSADAAARARPTASVVRLAENLGVAGFNAGADRASRPYLMVLDDDAAPAPGAVAAGLSLLRARPGLAAVALHPRHPATGRGEWPFAAGSSPRADWPVMGCGNIIRAADWRRAGGYEPSYFLYRNDADLALTFLALGRGVWFDPALVVEHDSPAAGRKSRRWFEVATRNWLWMCRRHGRGATRPAAMLAGWAWAHRLAGASPGHQAGVVRGVLAGLLRPAPRLPAGVRPDGRGLRRLISLRSRGRGSPPTAQLRR